MNQDFTPKLSAPFEALNRQVYKVVFDFYYLPLYYFTKKLVGDKQQAEDIVSDTLLKLWRLKDNFDSLHAIKAFLYITARNASLTHLRDIQRREQHHGKIAHLSTDSEDAAFDKNMMSSEILKFVYNEIEALPHQRKIIFKMIFFDGLDIAEVAQKLNITESTVRSHKKKAVDELKMKIFQKGLAGAAFFATIRYLFTLLRHYWQNWLR